MQHTSNTQRTQDRIYDYHDREGCPRWRVKRYYQDGKKRFAQQRWDGTRWVNGLADTKPPIYRLPEIR